MILIKSLLKEFYFTRIITNIRPNTQRIRQDFWLKMSNYHESIREYSIKIRAYSCQNTLSNSLDNKRKIRAFTLIEILVTLTIFSIISVGIYSTFSSGIIAWRRSKDANRLFQEARWALNKMSLELQNAIDYNFATAYPDLTAFKGENDNISFLIGTDSGIKRITYFLGKEEFGTIHKTIVNYQGKLPSSIIVNYREIDEQLVSLLRKEEPFVQSLNPKEITPTGAKALCSIVKDGSLSFEYASSGTSEESGLNEGIAWAQTWQADGGLPRGVKIKLTLKNPAQPFEELEFVKLVFIPTGIISEEENAQ